jgi:hypothetical protein
MSFVLRMTHETADFYYKELPKHHTRLVILESSFLQPTCGEPLGVPSLKLTRPTEPQVFRSADS